MRLARLTFTARRRETVDPSAVNPQEEPGTIVIGYGPVGRTLTRLLRENKLNPTVIDLNYDSVQSSEGGRVGRWRGVGFAWCRRLHRPP